MYMYYDYRENISFHLKLLRMLDRTCLRNIYKNVARKHRIFFLFFGNRQTEPTVSLKLSPSSLLVLPPLRLNVSPTLE